MQGFMDGFNKALSEKDGGGGGEKKQLTATEEADEREKRMRGEALKIKERQRMEVELRKTAEIQAKSHAANAKEQAAQAAAIEAVNFARLPKWKQDQLLVKKAAAAEQANTDAQHSAVPAWKRQVAAKKRNSIVVADEAAAELKRRSGTKDVHARLGTPAAVTSDGTAVLSKIGYEQRDQESHAAHQSFTTSQEERQAAEAAAEQARAAEELAKQHMDLQAVAEEKALLAAMPIWKRAVYLKKKEAKTSVGPIADNDGKFHGDDEQTKGPDWAEGCDLSALDRQRLMKLPAWKRAIQLRKRAKQKRSNSDEDAAASLERAAGVAERIAEQQAEHDDDEYVHESTLSTTSGGSSPRRVSSAAVPFPDGGDTPKMGLTSSVFALLQARKGALEDAEKEAEKRATPAKLLTAAKLQKKKVDPIPEEDGEESQTAPIKKKKKKNSLAPPKESPPMPRRRSVMEMHQDVKEAAKKAREEKVMSLKAAMLIQRAFRRFKVRRQKRLQAEAEQLQRIQMQSESLRLEAATDAAIAQEQMKQLALIQAQRKLLSEKLRKGGKGHAHPGRATSNGGRPKFNSPSSSAGHHGSSAGQKTHRHAGGGGAQSTRGTRAPQAAPSAARTARKGAVAEAIRQAKLNAAPKKTGVSEAADSSNGIYIVDGQFLNKDGTPADHELEL